MERRPGVEMNVPWLSAGRNALMMDVRPSKPGKSMSHLKGLRRMHNHKKESEENDAALPEQVEGSHRHTAAVQAGNQSGAED